MPTVYVVARVPHTPPGRKDLGVVELAVDVVLGTCDRARDPGFALLCSGADLGEQPRNGLAFLWTEPASSRRSCGNRADREVPNVEVVLPRRLDLREGRPDPHRRGCAVVAFTYSRPGGGGEVPSIRRARPLEARRTHPGRTVRMVPDVTRDVTVDALGDTLRPPDPAGDRRHATRADEVRALQNRWIVPRPTPAIDDLIRGRCAVKGVGTVEATSRVSCLTLPW